MTEITDARIDDKDLDRWANPEGQWFSAEARTFAMVAALEIRRLRKREEDARGLLQNNQGMRVVHGTDGYCIECGGAVWPQAVRAEIGCKEPKIDCASDCAIAAWLKGE